MSVGAPLRRRDRGERGRKEHLVPQPNFYDADSIAQGLGSYDDPTLQFEARTRVDAAIGRHLEQNESFGFESTYSGASRPRIARRAHELGDAT